MNEVKKIYMLAVLFLFVACNLRTSENSPIEDDLLPPLDSGIVYYQDKSVFDTLIYLDGVKVLQDSSDTKIGSIPQFFLKNDQLIIYKINYPWESKETNIEFRHYSLPALELVKTVSDTTIIPYHTILSEDMAIVCFLRYPSGVSRSHPLRSFFSFHELYKYDDSGVKQTRLKTLPVGLNDFSSSIYHIGDNEFIFTRDSAIIRATATTDTVYEEIIHNLNLSPNTGKLIVNTAKSRMVYAYTSFDVIQVVDLDTKAIKTIDFQNGDYSYDRKHMYGHGIPNPNRMYYTSAYAGSDYFYLLYYGYIYGKYASETVRGWEWNNRTGTYMKTDEYAQNYPSIVEQYDWNGNPIARYILKGDPTLKLSVDEQRKQFYLASSECYVYFNSVLLCNESLIIYSY